MKILIVDDEAPAREIIRHLLQKYFPETTVCAEAVSVEQAYQAVLLHNPELVLLDVDMPDGTAFDFLRKLTSVNFSIIFITAYENRFSINKILELTETNNMIVKYDINLEMEYI
jgi:two-component system LytT family response regulator